MRFDHRLPCRAGIAAWVLISALLFPEPSRAATVELTCTSLLSRKGALEALAKRQQLLVNSCNRSRDSGAGQGTDFCGWAEEARRDMERCRAASVNWASSLVLRFDPDRAQDANAEIRHYACFTYPEPESVDAATVTTKANDITVVARKSKQLHDRYAQRYQPLVIDRATMRAGYEQNIEYRCQLPGGRGLAGQAR